MAVRIRLRRIGKRPHKRPFFRISVMDSKRARDSAFIEELGYYNPLEGKIELNLEKLQYWIKNGAQPTEAVEKLIKKYTKINKGEKDATTNKSSI